jgi:RNA polymerase-interacting CarD/CdnL/TRCF family regulator
MTATTLAYSSGDWIVHRHHGVGQIKGTEVKDIGGRKNKYYRVQTDDSTFWLPLEKLTNDLLRPLASPVEMQEALDVLELSPRTMDANPTERKVQISKVKPNNSPVVIAEILRDLSAHNKEKKQVSQTDAEALRHFTALFLAEWSVCMNLDIRVLKQQLSDMLA